MITKRARRAVQQTESLQQMAIAFKNGMDESKPVNDQNSVLRLDNFRIEPDGTARLRKPIVVHYQDLHDDVSNTVEVFGRTFDPDVNFTFGYVNDAYYFTISSFSDNSLSIYLKYKSITGATLKSSIYGLNTVNANTRTVGFGFSLELVKSYVVTPDSVVLTGYITLKSVLEPNGATLNYTGPYVADPSNPRDPFETKVLRKLKLYKTKNDNTWCLEIVDPETSRLDTSDSELPLDLNLDLDYPYAISDRYNASAPFARAIIPYAMTYKEDWIYPSASVSALSVANITTNPVYNIKQVSRFAQGQYPVALKAYVDLKFEKDSPFVITDNVWARWEYTTDNIHWTPVSSVVTDDSGHSIATLSVREADTKWTLVSNSDDAPDLTYANHTYYRISLSNMSNNDSLKYRPDVLIWSLNHSTGYSNYPTNATFRFTMISVHELESDDPAYDTETGGTQYGKNIVYSQLEYTPAFGESFEAVEEVVPKTDNPERLLYHDARLFQYGAHGRFVLVSNPGEFGAPLSNVIDLPVSTSETVTSVLPWRSYYIISTERSLHLAIPSGTGFVLKTINTAIGIEPKDYRCCKPMLNGVILKSGYKIYMLYPNIYASDDTIINLTDISKPIESALLEFEDTLTREPFAISTESEYILAYPGENTTKCLRYNITLKTWAIETYPVVFTDCYVKSLNEIYVYSNLEGNVKEYFFNKTFDEIRKIDFGTPELDFKIPETPEYGDILVPIDLESDIVPITPIDFEIDTGQKTDMILTTKQFVETKLVLATLNYKETFPMNVLVHIDGDPHIAKLDIPTDAPLWRSSIRDSIVLNTGLHIADTTDDTAYNNVLYNLQLRHIGRGKSIRYIISGSSHTDFKIYEIYARYKRLTNK